jgi:hypothetical protein
MRQTLYSVHALEDAYLSGRVDIIAKTRHCTKQQNLLIRCNPLAEDVPSIV